MKVVLYCTYVTLGERNHEKNATEHTVVVFPSLCDVEKERVREETAGNIATEGQLVMVY